MTSDDDQASRGDVIESICIKNRAGHVCGPFDAYRQGSRFVLATSEWQQIHVTRHDTLLITSDGRHERRILGVSILSQPMVGSRLVLLAPREITSAVDLNAPYITDTDVELRPGARIIGGRDSGFYDAPAIILDAVPVGGDRERDEDWAYRVVAPSDFGRMAPLWILLADVGLGIASPSSVMALPGDLGPELAELLDKGERELFEYFVNAPERLASLSPKQLEKLMVAIYRNLGFVTEPIGAWNQADGGVDLLAVSRTEAGTEFRLAIQCKTSKDKISAQPIRELAGVLEAFKAHQGVVATTSRFTAPAQREVEGHLWKIALQDRDEIFRRMVAILLPGLKV